MLVDATSDIAERADAALTAAGFDRDRGSGLKTTQDGRYAEALLERLGSLDDLDSLASRNAVELLQRLAPVSRLKLAQRIARQIKDEHDVDEAKLAELLKAAEVHLELPSRAASDLTSPRQRVPDVLKVLTPLVNAGFVVRARSTRCPRCNFLLSFRLDQLAERVECDACRALFMLPVATPDGRRPPTDEFRLDGLAARAMDQDILPVLVTLRALRLTIFRGSLFHAWPGIEMTRGGKAVDVDVMAHGPYLLFCEVKAHASGLHTEQLDDLLELCDAVGARPGVAALDGQFGAEVQRAIDARSGLVFERAQLIA